MNSFPLIASTATDFAISASVDYVMEEYRAVTQFRCWLRLPSVVGVLVEGHLSGVPLSLSDALDPEHGALHLLAAEVDDLGAIVAPHVRSYLEFADAHSAARLARTG